MTSSLHKEPLRSRLDPTLVPIFHLSAATTLANISTTERVTASRADWIIASAPDQRSTLRAYILIFMISVVPTSILTTGVIRKRLRREALLPWTPLVTCNTANTSGARINRYGVSPRARGTPFPQP